MDCHHCITESAERKKGQHLRMENRGAIKALKKQGLSVRTIEDFTDEDILAAADELNGRPRKKLGYCTPAELFEAFLDAVYVA